MSERWDYDGPLDNIHVFERDRPHMRVCFMTSDGPTEERARLIAAAPDMLRALKASRLYVEILEKHLDPTLDPAAPTIREHASMVRAAIAKAEGSPNQASASEEKTG